MSPSRETFLTILFKIAPMSHCILLPAFLYNTYFHLALEHMSIYLFLMVSSLKCKLCLDRVLVIFVYFYSPSTWYMVDAQ